jgi:hypothetical protein
MTRRPAPPPPPPPDFARALREACEVAQQRGEIKANVRALVGLIDVLTKRRGK